MLNAFTDGFPSQGDIYVVFSMCCLLLLAWAGCWTSSRIIGDLPCRNAHIQCHNNEDHPMKIVCVGITNEYLIIQIAIHIHQKQ